MIPTTDMPSQALAPYLTPHDIKALSYWIPASCLSLGLAFCLGAHFGAKNVQSKEEPDSEREGDEDEGSADGDLSSIKPRTMEQCKLVCFSQFSS